jgi:hypothetical protein
MIFRRLQNQARCSVFAWKNSLAPSHCSNPTRIFAGDLIFGGKTNQPMLPNRIYLDVTEATQEDVKEFWTVVEFAKDRLRERNLPASKPQGAPRGPRKGSKVERWFQLAREIGERPARLKFKAEVALGRGDWAREYRWWYRHIRPEFVQKSR